MSSASLENILSRYLNDVLREETGQSGVLKGSKLGKKKKKQQSKDIKIEIGLPWWHSG